PTTAMPTSALGWRSSAWGEWPRACAPFAPPSAPAPIWPRPISPSGRPWPRADSWKRGGSTCGRRRGWPPTIRGRHGPWPASRRGRLGGWGRRRLRERCILHRGDSARRWTDHWGGRPSLHGDLVLAGWQILDAIHSSGPNHRGGLLAVRANERDGTGDGLA